MKFYDCTTAPSPRRVRIFLSEKGISVPTVQVDLRDGEQFTPAFRAINPDCTVPVLELDNGTTITDILAICRYFEELNPDPPLMGQNAEERAVIASWLRRIEWDGCYAAMDLFRNSTPGRSPTSRSLRSPSADARASSISSPGSMRGSPTTNSSAGSALRLPISAQWLPSISPAGQSSRHRNP
jgi:glutathione S-transferase